MAYGTRQGILWRAFVLVSWCLLAMACSDDAVPVEQVAPTGNHSARVAQPDEAALRASMARAMQRDASAAYAAVDEGLGRYFLANSAKRLTATVDRAGLLVRANESASSFSLRTSAYGCDGAMREVGEREPSAERNRVSYARPELAMEEWYVNGPLGVEQGFAISEAPSCTGTKVITMETLGDVAPALEDPDGDGRGDWVRFVADDGRTHFVYRDLVVVDAAGKKLPAWMTVEAGGMAIHFEDAGAVYPVEVDPVIAVLEANLLAADGTSGDLFGTSVAIDGDTAIVGAYNDDILAGGTLRASQGSAYVFVRSGTTWTQQAKLVASDGDQFDQFGISVALSGDTVLIGARYDDNLGVDSGSAYVFVRNGATWSQQAELNASDGATGDQFGCSVALDGDTAIVGAFGADVGGNFDMGSAYVFERSGWTWIEEIKLLEPGGTSLDRFGYSVALSGDTALIGAPFSDDGAFDADFGTAWAYTRSGSMWILQQKFSAPDRKSGDYFGLSVALSGDNALVGAPNTDEFGPNSGSAYVFIRNGSIWNLRDKLLPVPGGPGVRFGTSVAVSGDTVLVGAPYDDIGAAVDQGSAFVFAPRKTNGEVCATATECVSGYCADSVCCDARCDGPCQACSAQTNGVVDGSCLYFAQGTDPENDCALDAPSTCQRDGVCDGNGACRLWAPGTSCRTDECVGNVSKSSFCNGLGTCRLDLAGTDCGANGCDPATGQCISTCATDAACPADAFCNPATSQCVPKGTLGTACTAFAQCQSGHCADGVCCNEPCDGTCRACNANGICSPVAAGTEDPACPKDPINTCGFSGECNSVGTCALFGPLTPCGAQTCTNCTFHDPHCDGKGMCVIHHIPCGNFNCDTQSCKTTCSSNDDCKPDTHCQGGTCQVYATNGKACSVDNECKSGHCVTAAEADGPAKICCEAACAFSTGDACGNTGRCTAAGKCELEPLGKPCGIADCSEDGHRYTRQMCVNGKCVADPSVDVDCSPYQCESAWSCKSSCNGDADCISTHACRNGRCGVKTCDDTTKCLEGESCDPNTKSCISAVAAPEGCACQTPGSHSSNSRWFVLALSLGFSMLRRRSAS